MVKEMVGDARGSDLFSKERKGELLRRCVAVSPLLDVIIGANVLEQGRDSDQCVFCGHLYHVGRLQGPEYICVCRKAK